MHLIPETLEELKAANPVFTNELFSHAKVLFARLPLEVFLKPLTLQPYSLIIYEMSGLSYREKMKVIYLLYRKNGAGALAKIRGTKLNDGCVLVPNSVGDEIVATLSSLGVKAKKLEIYVSEDSFETWLGQKQTVTQRNR